MMKLPKIDRVRATSDDRRLMTIVGTAAIISVFCLASTKVLLSQAAYKRHIISARRDAVKALDADLAKSDALKSQYQIFEGTNPKNIIGGRNITDKSAAPPDGNNSRIVLDALPSSYDFPALISSMSKIMTNNGITNPSISGTDQSDKVDSTPSSNPSPVPISLSVSGSSSYSQVQSVIKDFERSIRPFDLTNLHLQGSESAMTFSANLNTYFQPSKTLKISDKAVQ